MAERSKKEEELLNSYNQIMKHCEKCSVCRKYMEMILQHAIDVGEYKP